MSGRRLKSGPSLWRRALPEAVSATWVMPGMTCRPKAMNMIFNGKGIGIMKNIGLISGMALLAFAFAACSKEEISGEPSAEGSVNLTITTAPELVSDFIDSRTTITQDPEDETLYHPSWTGNEKMGIWIDSVPSSGEAQPDFLDNAATGDVASFKGSVSMAAGQHTIYGYASSADKYVAKYFGYGVGFDIPQVQHPTLSAFDSDADLLIAKPQTLDIQEAQTEAVLEDVQFARPLAVVKVVLKDASSKELKGNAIVKSLTLTPSGEDYLTGRYVVDVTKGSFSQFNKLSAVNVKAEYTDESFVINDENAAWLVVNPITFGSSLTLTVDAGKYTVSKTLDVAGIELKSGDVTVLNVSLKDEDITVEESGLALPFEDDFSGYTGTSAIGSLPNFDIDGSVYAQKGSVRFGTSSKTGTVTTKSALDLSEPFTVIVFGTGWANDEHGLVISAGNQTKTMSFTTDMSSNTEYDECLYAYFDAETALTKVSFSNTSGERVLLKNIRIVSGEWIPSPEIESVETVKAAPSGTSAVLSGSYKAYFIGENDVVKYGFEWGKEGSEMASVEASNAVDGEFSHELTGLSVGQSYTFKAWAQLNDGEKMYGEEMSFTVTGKASWEHVFTSEKDEGLSGEINGMNDKGLQLTKSKGNVTYTKSDFEGEISSITLMCANNASSGNGTVTVTVNGVSLKCEGETEAVISGCGTTLTPFVFETDTPLSGEVVVHMQATVNSVYWYSIKIN